MAAISRPTPQLGAALAARPYRTRKASVHSAAPRTRDVRGRLPRSRRVTSARRIRQGNVSRQSSALYALVCRVAPVVRLAYLRAPSYAVPCPF